MRGSWSSYQKNNLKVFLKCDLSQLDLQESDPGHLCSFAGSAQVVLRNVLDPEDKRRVLNVALG